MSLSQTKIINRLLNLANSSKINMRHAAGIYKGRKELFSSVNMERNKFNRNIYICGHSEAVCIHRYLSCHFKGKRNPSLVLASLSGKATS